MASATAAASRSSANTALFSNDASQNSLSIRNFNFSTLGRASIGVGRRGITSSKDLEIFEATSELLSLPVTAPEHNGSDEVSLLRGFKATIPSSEKGKARRRQMRNVDLGVDLKRRGEIERGLLVGAPSGGLIHRGNGLDKRKNVANLGSTVRLGKEELDRQRQEILLDKENLSIRRVNSPH